MSLHFAKFSFFLKILFIHETESEREAEAQADGEPDVGFNPRTQGSQPEPKADTTTELPRSLIFFFLRLNAIHCLYVTHFLYSFICQWAIRVLLHLAIVINTTINMSANIILRS